MKRGQWIIILAVCGGLVSWVLDGVIDYLFFSEKPLADAVLLGISSHDLFMRSVVLALFIAFGLVAYRVFRAQQRAEDAKAEARSQLVHARKFEALGTLASGVAHDFSNSIMAILAYASLAKEALADGHPAAEPLRKLEEAASKAGEVTKSLLTYTRRVDGAKLPVDLTHLVRGTGVLWRGLLPKSITMTTDVPADAAVWVNADPARLQQAMIDLAVNARDAMPNGGQLHLTLSTDSATDCSGTPHSIVESNGQAVLVVEDTGIGMSSELQDRVFEPVSTTKTRAQGTGLGLSVTHGIVVDHGGNIGIRSAPGAGTRVTIALPCCSPPADTRPADMKKRVRPGTGEPVVLLEGDQHVRSIMVSTLHEEGYEVIQARDFAEALAAIRAPAPGAELLVANFDMLGPYVRERLEEIEELRPGFPAVFIAADESVVHGDDLKNNQRLLQMPYKMSRLSSMITDMLSGSSVGSGVER